ncbi:unnamed protein product [Didymodactylos carnosus]|uniref:Uncharacterized protein n=2 Tax=Didymodactylos carnosus TaxID=1234261 RepID=A0A814T2S7_9BILA|nr:unnamed protein product [Didymodactylos carnosus]CAF3919321.1 unnamed protein product [Didymodactylos carnosus]
MYTEMSTSKPVEWVISLITRFEDQLPMKCGELTSCMRLNLEQNKHCQISLSRYKFSLVINGLTDILKTIDSTLLNVAGDGVTVQHVRQLASHVLFALSVNNFSTLFFKVVSRLKCLIASGDETCEAGDLDLIQHMNVDMSKLTRLLNEEVQKWRLLKKIHHTELVKSVEKFFYDQYTKQELLDQYSKSEICLPLAIREQLENEFRQHRLDLEKEHDERNSPEQKLSSSTTQIKQTDELYRTAG